MSFILIIVSLLVLISVFGIVKKNRVLFNTGYFLYGLIVVFAEFGNYAENGELIHLGVAFLWMIQAVLAIPNKLPYDGSKIAKSAGIKIFSVYSLINIFGVFLALQSEYLANQLALIHGVLAVLPVIPMALILTDKIEITK